MSRPDSSITRAIPRPDGPAKAVGDALYVADLKFESNRPGEGPGTSPNGGVPLGIDGGLSPDMLAGRLFRSPHSRGRITGLNLPETPDGYSIITAGDIPAGGENVIPLAASRDFPCFAETEVRFAGQIVALVAGPDPAVVDRLVGEIDLRVEPLPVCVGMDAALSLEGGAIHQSDNIYCRVNLDHGDVDAAFAAAAEIVEGSYRTGFQEQFYMEGQGLITWRDGESVGIRGSLQCPYYVSHAVSHVLGLPEDRVRVIQDTVGGAFGGKEDYPEIMGAPMAVASWVTGKPIRMIMDRGEDLAFTSKRHPSRCVYRSALDEEGNILGVDASIDLDGGAYETYTRIVLMRAVFTSMGVYNFPAFRIRGRGIATNTPPSGAFRGFGAPQALFGIEMHMEEIARRRGEDPLELRRRHFAQKGDRTVTGGTYRDAIILDTLTAKAEELSGYSAKRREYAAGSPDRAPGPGREFEGGPNRAPGPRRKFGAGPDRLRGIGISFIVHGCGFTGDGEQTIIKGKVALEKGADDRVEILCAAVDFGQGPQTTIRKVAAEVLNLRPGDIVFNYPDTFRVPDSGPSVASRTMMVVGYLVQKAAEDLKVCWVPGKKQRVERSYELPPGIAWNQETLQGDCYAAYGWGVNVCEVEVDPRTWETEVTGAWGVYDVGRAIDRRVVDGQIQGGMSQALGYGALEKLEADKEGRYRQVTMSDYMVPTSLDFPRTGAATVENPYPYGAFGAKGMGEMVHDGGHAAFAAAVEQAVGLPCPEIPLVPETLLAIVEEEEAQA